MGLVRVADCRADRCGRTAHPARFACRTDPLPPAPPASASCGARRFQRHDRSGRRFSHDDWRNRRGGGGRRRCWRGIPSTLVRRRARRQGEGGQHSDDDTSSAHGLHVIACPVSHGRHHGQIFSLLALVAWLFMAGAPTLAADAIDLDDATIAELNAALTAEGTLTSEAGAAVARPNQAYHRQGPSLHAVLTLNPKALEVARALDAERKAKGPRSPSARHSDRSEGQLRHLRPADHRRLGPSGGIIRQTTPSW